MIGDTSLQQQIRQGILDFLKDPTQYPDELKAWIPKWLEVSPAAIQLQDIQNLYQVSSTISGLGVKVHGRIGGLTLGTSPSDILPMQYDGTLGRWVSLTSWQLFRPEFSATTLVDPPALADPVVFVKNFYAMYALGMTPQLRQMSYLTPAVGHAANLRAAIYSVNSGSTTVTLLYHDTEVTSTGNGIQFSEWVDATMDSTPSANAPHAVLCAQGWSTSGTATFDYTNALLRMTV